MKRTVAGALSSAALALALLAGTPAFAAGHLDEALVEQLTALGIDDETIAMIEDDHVEEIEAILASDDEDEVKRTRILELVDDEADAVEDVEDDVEDGEADADDVETEDEGEEEDAG